MPVQKLIRKSLLLSVMAAAMTICGGEGGYLYARQVSPEPDVRTRVARPTVTAEERTRQYDAFQAADPSAGYSLEIWFDQPQRLGDVRDVVERLGVLRVLVHPEGADSGGSIGLGRFYEGLPAWDYGVCQALLRAHYSRNATLETSPAADWLTSKLTAYGSAHSLRELTAGTHLGATTITSITAQDRRIDERFREAVRREVEQPLGQRPQGSSLPQDCDRFFRLADAPVLTGAPVELSPAEAALPADDRVRSQLANLVPSVPVTLDIRFSNHLSIEDLAQLVQRHRIDGMTAELSPPSEPGEQRQPIQIAEFSVHGAALDTYVLRSRCAIDAGSGTGLPSARHWSASRAGITLSAQTAQQLLDDPLVGAARLTGVFEPSDLERMNAYYTRTAEQPLIVGPSTTVPAGCEAVMRRSN